MHRLVACHGKIVKLITYKDDDIFGFNGNQVSDTIIINNEDSIKREIPKQLSILCHLEWFNPIFRNYYRINSKDVPV
jgi:hypothetical protein